MLKNIEDCLEKLDNLICIYPYSTPPGYVHPAEQISGWDQKFISDVTKYTVQGSPLSTSQSNVALKIIERYISLFDASAQNDVRVLLGNPQYRVALKQTVEFPREVRWAGGTVLLFRYKYNAQITSDIKDLPCELPEIYRPALYREAKLWRVTVDNSNYKEVMGLIKKHNFNFDDDVLTMFMHINNCGGERNTISMTSDTIQVDINNDVLSSIWVAEMEWLKNV